MRGFSVKVPKTGEVSNSLKEDIRAILDVK